MNKTLIMVFISLTIILVAAVFVIVLDFIVKIVFSFDKAHSLNSTGSTRLIPNRNNAENDPKRQCFQNESQPALRKKPC